MVRVVCRAIRMKERMGGARGWIWDGGISVQIISGTQLPVKLDMGNG